MGYLALVAARHGRAAGWATIVGITAGLAVYMLAAVIGLAEAMTRAPWLYQALRFAGVGYLLWLAVEAWRGTPDGAPAVVSGAYGRFAWRGFVANVLNPKAAVFYVTLLPGFTRPDEGGVAGQILALGAIHLAVSIAVHGAVVWLAGAARPYAAGANPWLRMVFALGLVAVAAWLAWSTRG
jgi:threonine/homoserine/homoserine lactone efflux protein